MVGPRRGQNLSIATALAFAGLWATEHFGPALPWGRAKCLKASMNDHVGKPIELRKLLDCIERWHAHNQRVA